MRLLSLLMYWFLNCKVSFDFCWLNAMYEPLLSLVRLSIASSVYWSQNSLLRCSPFNTTWYNFNEYTPTSITDKAVPDPDSLFKPPFKWPVKKGGDAILENSPLPVIAGFPPKFWVFNILLDYSIEVGTRTCRLSYLLQRSICLHHRECVFVWATLHRSCWSSPQLFIDSIW